jgi:hypothetical protein
MPPSSNPNVPYCGFGADDTWSTILSGANGGGGAGGLWVAQPASAVEASANANNLVIMVPSKQIPIRLSFNRGLQAVPAPIDD